MVQTHVRRSIPSFPRRATRQPISRTIRRVTDPEPTTGGALDHLVEAVVSYRADLWREYEIVQKKIDSATRFRMVVLGWSLTAASLVSVAVGASKLSLLTSVAALLFTAALLVVVHKQATTHLMTGLAMGGRARILEREIDTTRTLLDHLRGADRTSIDIATQTISDLQRRDKRTRRRRGRKLSTEERIVYRTQKALKSKTPHISVAATSNRLGWRTFGLLCTSLFIPRRWRPEEAKSFAPSMLESRQILWVQIGFVLIGFIFTIVAHDRPDDEPSTSPVATDTDADHDRDSSTPKQRSKTKKTVNVTTPAEGPRALPTPEPSLPEDVPAVTPDPLSHDQTIGSSEESSFDGAPLPSGQDVLMSTTGRVTDE